MWLKDFYKSEQKCYLEVCIHVINISYTYNSVYASTYKQFMLESGYVLLKLPPGLIVKTCLHFLIFKEENVYECYLDFN